jgi:hypothetical protein
MFALWLRLLARGSGLSIPRRRRRGGGATPNGSRGFAHYLAAHGVSGPVIAWSAVAAVIELFGSVAIVLGLKGGGSPSVLRNGACRP